MSDIAEGILRKMLDEDYCIGGYFDIEMGIVDVRLDDLTDEEQAYLKRLRAAVVGEPSTEPGRPQ